MRGVKGGPPNFLGGEFFLISAFFGDTPSHPPCHPPTPGTRHRNRVNVRPVGILLECILVFTMSVLT